MSQPPVTTLDVRSAMEGAGALVRRSRPGEGVPEPFGHQFQSSAALLLVVERGELTVRVQRQEVALRAPGALLVRSGVTVSGWDGRSSDYWMVLIEAGLAEHIGTVEGLPMEVARNFDAFRDVMADLDEPLGLGNATAERLGFLLRELALELEDRDSGFRMATRSLLALMLVQLRRQQQLQMSREFSQDHILFSEVLDYIDRHFDRPLEMGEIADAVGRSPAHLTTLLRRSTGKTLLGWVTDRRMAEARRLLVETSVPVAEIATRVGYGSPSYFTRVFGRHVGESPARFRSRNRRRVR